MDPYITRDIIEISVALTGYRPGKLPFGYDLNHPCAIRLRALLKTEFERLILAGCRRFCTGGALGVDMLAAEVILELMEEYEGKIKIMHQLCIPCEEHFAKWRDEERQRFFGIATRSTCYYVSHKPYFNGCMQQRNKYMVDTCRIVIAVYDGQKGGTHNTVEYAKEQNRHLIIIDPKQFTRLELIGTPGDVDMMDKMNKF